MKNIPKTVFALGLVSLFTDISTEMITPILPLFLTQVLGAGPMAIGIIEGIAQTTASLLQIVSGFWTDKLRKRKPLILLGYTLSGFFRPFIGLAQAWPVVLILRFVDRVGKGIRTAPRDALIADVSTPANRGASFGLHQSMDHAGALLGPLVALLLVSPIFNCSYRNVFLLSAVPALAAWLTLVFVVHEKNRRAHGNTRKLDLRADIRELGPGFGRLLFALLIFTLGNSTDAFLVIQLSQVGVTTTHIILLWAAFSGVKMVFSYYGGRWADDFSRKSLILSGWILYALVYLSFAVFRQTEVVIGIFLIYGIYFGLCEPAEKALVADLVPQSLRGTAFGYYSLVIGLGALPASLLFGWVGQVWGYPAAFTMGACFAGLASLLLFFGLKSKRTLTVAKRG